MNKSQAREFCFQYLFHLQLPIFEESKKSLQSSVEDLKMELIEFQASSDIELTPALFNLALNQIENTVQSIEKLEQVIIPHLKSWKLDRISKVDKTVLLLAINELENAQETPMKVVLNEAVELAKKYGTEDSPKFVNAILDKIAKTYV